MTELASAAVSYAELGWPVFPVEPKGKRPLGRLVPHGLKEATTDVDVVMRWWRSASKANVGLATGHAFDVLDIDSEEAHRALRRAIALQPEGAPTIDGPTCDTGGGGWHVYVQPLGIGNKAGLLGEKLDWRGAGGYVVAPPSVHPSGKRYTWGAGPDGFCWSQEVPLQPLPMWAKELLGIGIERKPEPLPERRRQSDTPVGDRYGQRALQLELEAIERAGEGGRNHQLNESAFAIGQLIAGHAITDEFGAIQALKDAGLRAGLTQREVDATVGSGIRSGATKPRSVPA